MARGIGGNSPQKRVPQRWGYPFWEVVRDFADQGLTRFDVARAIDCTPQHFCKLLTANPDKDPFEPYGVVEAYVRHTGEAFGDALRRMAAEGKTHAEASREIGFTGKGPSLQYAMDVRGIEVAFRRARDPDSRLVERAVTLAGAGYTAGQAAKILGYARPNHLVSAIKRSGGSVEFPLRKSATVSKSSIDEHPWRKMAEQDMRIKGIIL